MKTLLWIIGIALLLIIGWYAINGSLATNDTQNGTEQETQEQNAMTNSVQVTPISHATLMLAWDGTVVYADPTDASLFAGKPAADIVLVTDIHGDHFSSTTLAQVVGPDTTLIVPQAVKDQISGELAERATVLANGSSTDAEGIRVEAVPMYNLPDADNANFHTKGRGNGYVLEHEGERVYIAGDTAGTPEMRALRDIDIAFVPMNLPYTMDVDEAADAVLAFKPKTVYPYHYRGPDGLSDVNRFKQLVNAGDSSIEVILADWYPGE